MVVVMMDGDLISRSHAGGSHLDSGIYSLSIRPSHLVVITTHNAYGTSYIVYPSIPSHLGIQTPMAERSSSSLYVSPNSDSSIQFVSLDVALAFGL